MWNYFNLSDGNNKLIALDIDGNFEWEFTLPSGSFSSPAVHDDIVIVGCENIGGDTIFAIDVNTGEEIWNNNIGPIGRCSPVIYENKVIITAKVLGTIPFTGYEKIIALDFSDGTELWNLSIGDNIADNYEKIGIASSSVKDDSIYAVSADGTIYSINTNNGDLSSRGSELNFLRRLQNHRY